MSLLDFTLESPVHASFRVQQIAGLFDLPLAEKSSVRIAVEVPSFDEDWRIGLIVGPSGSGKSSVARRAFPGCVYDPAAAPWPADRAVIDGFGDLPIKNICAALTAVGLSSPPAWVKPYTVLSTGERFRCDLARALLMGSGVEGVGSEEAEGKPSSVESGPRAAGNRSFPDPRPSTPSPILVFDEFTSVVDRTVARVGSAAVAKALRGGRFGAPLRFVAATCHYDVADWLGPDWVVDMATRTLARGWLPSTPGSAGRQRPAIELAISRCHPRRCWPRFAPHHYLSGELPLVCEGYLAAWECEPVAFAAVSPVYGRRGRWRISRLVVLPDYQGIGVGGRFRDAVAELTAAGGRRVGLATSHPAMIRSCEASPHWRRTKIAPAGNKPCRGAKGGVPAAAHSLGRCVVSFRYVGV